MGSIGPDLHHAPGKSVNCANANEKKLAKLRHFPRASASRLLPSFFPCLPLLHFHISRFSFVLSFAGKTKNDDPFFPSRTSTLNLPSITDHCSSFVTFLNLFSGCSCTIELVLLNISEILSHKLDVLFIYRIINYPCTRSGKRDW